MSSATIVASFIAGVPSGLSTALLKDMVAYAEGQGAKNIRIDWLAEGEAADLFCEGLAAEKLRALLVEKLQGQKVDVIVQPVEGRRKKLLLADMESTIIQQEMLDEMADAIGQREKVAAITARAMNGEIDFAGALRERVALLQGQPASLMIKVMERITPMPGAEALIATMKKHGAICWLVSGGFTCFVQPVAAKLGFHEAYANTLAVENNLISGSVIEPVLDKDTKKALLEHACKQHGVALSETITVGDGANDIPMLDACNAGGGLGIAYHAKPHVRAAVAHQVNCADLRALLYAQGYRSQDIVS
ncbi:MAG: phosphoserine phosphatase SerB [Alphaproteobacteria bacterium]|nr:phosphoserine phosphatase SerB [Alphaproteobacteria bacterium]